MKRADREVRDRGHSARRSVSLLSLATLVGQGVTFATIPVITRIYEPVVYGDYQTLYAAVTILGVVASLRLERAIPLAPDELRTRAVIIAAYSLTMFTMGVLMVLCLLVPATMASLLGNPRVASVIWVVPLAAALTSGYVIATQWAIRVQRHGPIAMRNALQPGVTAIVQILMGLVTATVGALNVGLIVGRFVGAFSAAKELFRRGERPTGHLVIGQLRRYRGFMLLSAPSALLNAAALQLPVLIVAATFGAADAGLYGVSALITVAPVTLLAGAMSQVTMGAVTERIRSGRPGVFPLIRRGVVLTGGIAVVAAGVVALCSRPISALLGSGWGDVVPFLLALSIVLTMRLPATAVSPALSALEMHGATLTIDVIRTLIVIGSLTYAYGAGWSVEEALYAMCIGVALTYLAAIVVTLRGARRHDHLVRRDPAVG